MSVTLLTSYDESNYTHVYDGMYGIGESFIGNGNVIDSVKFYLKKYGTPTGDLTAQIFTHTGTFGDSSLPTGGALATSDIYSVADLTTSLQLITFNFTGANRITLENGTPYIVARIGPSGGGVNTGYDAVSPTYAGNLVENANGISGWDAEPSDLIFYVYTDTLVTPIVGNKYPIPPFKKA